MNKKSKEDSNKNLPKPIVKKVGKSDISLKKGSNLQFYLKEISRYPLLTKDEELKWTKEFYETKDQQIAQILITSNLRFVVKIAGQYSRFSSKIMDLIQEGNMGLLKAVHNFNPYKGVRLITYAVWWIRGYVQEYLLKQHSIVRIGVSKKQRDLFYLLQKEQRALEDLSKKNDIILDISKSKNINRREIEELRERIEYKDISLDAPLGTDGKYSVLDLQIDKNKESMEDLLTNVEEKEKLNQVISEIKDKLNEKEKKILFDRILKDPPETLETIGNHFKVTKESIRQNEVKLMKKLKERLQILLKRF